MSTVNYKGVWSTRKIVSKSQLQSFGPVRVYLRQPFTARSMGILRYRNSV